MNSRFHFVMYKYVQISKSCTKIRKGPSHAFKHFGHMVLAPILYTKMGIPTQSIHTSLLEFPMTLNLVPDSGGADLGNKVN